MAEVEIENPVKRFPEYVRIYGITTTKTGEAGVEAQYKIYGTSNGTGSTNLSKNGNSTETMANAVI